MLFEVLPDPRPLATAKPEGAIRVLQFHRTIPELVPIGHFTDGGREVVDETMSRDEYLAGVLRACEALGDKLEVRFYDHFEEEFDASVLDRLPGIRRLTIDGLSDIRNADAIGRLPALETLRFGPRRLPDSKVLSVLGVERLTHFTLAGSPLPAIDLAPLAAAQSMQTLRLLGHGKNTEAIGEISGLTELALQPSTKVRLEFINRLVALQSLKLVLGNCASLQTVGALPSLSDLSFREVRHLEEIGDLERFPQLRRLQISDQPKLRELRVGAQNAALEHMYLYSLPGLNALHGLSDLPALRSLFAYDSRLDLAWSQLPATLTHFRLMTKALRGRTAHETEVAERGLISDVHPEATFFYK